MIFSNFPNKNVQPPWACDTFVPSRPLHGPEILCPYKSLNNIQAKTFFNLRLIKCGEHIQIVGLSRTSVIGTMRRSQGLLMGMRMGPQIADWPDLKNRAKSKTFFNWCPCFWSPQHGSIHWCCKYVPTVHTHRNNLITILRMSYN